ncbi:MAG: ArsA-related P-loop ATPase [Candidatus Aminicenantales bacterium]
MTLKKHQSDSSSTRKRWSSKKLREAYTFFNLFGYAVDLIIVNRLIPPEVHDIYFQKWKDIQKKYMQIIRECFSPLPILTSDFFPRKLWARNFSRRWPEKCMAQRTRLSFSSPRNPSRWRKQTVVLTCFFIFLSLRSRI